MRHNIRVPQFDTFSATRFAMRTMALVAVCLMVISATVKTAYSCPFCNAPQLTLAEQIAQSDAAVIAEWTKGTPPDFDAGTPGTTTYRIEKIIKSPDTNAVTIDQLIVLKEYYPGEAGQFSLIVGSQDLSVSTRLLEKRLKVGAFGLTPVEEPAQTPILIPVSFTTAPTEMNWLSPLDISKEGFEYVKNVPGPENDPQKRLRYYVNFLEAKDPLIADDAYAEFANAPYDTIAAVRESFPREKVRQWVFSEETSVTRLGLYGLLLGLCGDDSDRVQLKEKVVSNDEDFRLGIDGIMAGYLLLAGEEGLNVLEETKLKPSLKSPSPVPFSETFATLQSLKFLWEYAPGTVDKERLRSSMRILLQHPDLADLVIIDLARWEDWSLLPKLKEMYGSEPYDVPAIKRAIVGYLIACEKQRPEDPAAEVPQFVVSAGEYLAQLEETDPKTVKTARLLFR
ncbi:hypothetical protein [Rubinisphaera italica]|uniref:Uncharacterized protein n=1 Tax=Rubinisphaera italica TaxID=2527969 RepID=A0A5C5XGW8_9PLAN|nr:hypothetical protein [Rubinisphaera italica]TWT61112.1 hypothetical protein Pan54_18460 [Rubinisphaera italica]